MRKTYFLLISLLVLTLLLSGFGIVASGSEPLYKTGLIFTGRALEEGGEETYVTLEQVFAEIPNTFEAWIWLDPDWPLNKYPDGDPEDKRVGTIIGGHGAWNIEGFGPRDEAHDANFEVHTTGSPRIWWNSGEENIIATDFDFRTGEWIHFAVVRDETIRRGIFTFYKNGEQIYEWFLGAGSSVIPRDPPIIGGDYRSLPENTSGSRTWNGKIGELRVWSTARTGDEIKTYMNQELTGNEEGLLGYWKFDEGEGDILHDSSPYGNHGTIVNAEWYTE